MKSWQDLRLLDLNTLNLGQPSFYLEETTSTQDEIKRHLPHLTSGTTLLAGHQTQGRGRQGRSWTSLPGRQLFASILIRPELPPKSIPLCTLAAGLSTINALRDLSVSGVGLKWPNDIYVEGRKVAGILGEFLAPEPQTDHPSIVLGLGMNLQGDPKTLPDEFRDRTTTLEAQGYRLAPEQVLAHVLNQLETELKQLTQGLIKPLIQQLNENWIYKGKTISLELGQTQTQGQACEIRSDGALILKLPSGETRAFHSGEIKHLRTAFETQN